MKAYQIQYQTQEGNKFVEWVTGVRNEVDEYIDLRCRRKSWTLDELWAYDCDDPRVHTGHKGLIVAKGHLYPDFLEQLNLN